MAKKYTSGAAEALSALKQDLKEGAFGRLYIFTGEEHYLRNHYLDQLKKKLLEGPAAEFNFHRFTQENQNLSELAEAVEAMPMMAEYAMVLVEDWDLNTMIKADCQILTEILLDIPDFCTVVFLFDTVEYKVNKDCPQLAKAMKQGLKVEFARQSDRELASWIRRHFRNLGREIGDRECEKLIFDTGGSMTAMRSEIQKIAAYAEGTVITVQDIAAVVTPVLEAQVFDMTDAISEGNFEKALVILQTLFQLQEEPIKILAAIGSTLRRIAWAKIAASSGKGEAGLVELWKLSSGKEPHSFVVGKTMRAARQVPDSFCEAAMKLCLETDRQLKSYGGDKQRLMELLIVQLAQEARHG